MTQPAPGTVMDPTLQRFEQALKHAAELGDHDTAGQIAQAMRVYMKSMNPSLGVIPPAKIGVEGLPDQIRAVARNEGVGEQRLAGIGTAPVIAWEGLKGIFTDRDEQAIAEQKALRGATTDTGMGNIAGNALLFGLGPARAAGPIAEASGATKVAQALATRPGMVADTVGTAGAVNAATEPGTPLERVTAAVMGGGGAALPIVGVAGAQGVRRAVLPGGKRVAHAEALVREAGRPDAERLITELRKPYDIPALGVKPSAAMHTQNPLLEVMETGSRVRTGDQWRLFDKANAQERYEALLKAGGSPEELAQMKIERAKATDPVREEALQRAEEAVTYRMGEWGVSKTIPDTEIQPLLKKLAYLETGPTRPNKDVQELVGYLRGQIQEGMTPAQLYEVRKFLTEGIKAGRTDQLSQSVKSARPQRVEIVGLVDDTLDRLSGGKYREYMKSYGDLSTPITSKQAVQDITEALTRGRAPGEVPPALGESPASLTVGRLLERFGEKEFGSKVVDRLTPEHRRVVEAIVSDLKRQQDVMLPRTTLGSPTAPFLANAGRVDAVTNAVLHGGALKIPVAGNVVASKLGNKLGEMSERELVRLLQNPEEMAKALEAALRAEVITNRASRIGGASGGAVGEGAYK